MTANGLVQKLWNYCNILRDDGLPFRLRRATARRDENYVEQLIPLGAGLFLKMADEQSKPPYVTRDKRRDSAFARGFRLRSSSYDGQVGGRAAASTIPKGLYWPSLLARDGDALEIHYRHTLEELGKRSGSQPIS